MEKRKVGLTMIQVPVEFHAWLKVEAEKAGKTMTDFMVSLQEERTGKPIDTEFARQIKAERASGAFRDTGRGRPKTSKVDTLNGRTLKEDDEYWKAKQVEGMKTNSYAYQREPGYEEWYKRNFGYMHKRLDPMGGF